MKLKHFLTIVAFTIAIPSMALEPLRVAVAGVTHDHIAGVVSAIKKGQINVVGVFEKDAKYLSDNALRGLVPDSLFYASLQEMLDSQKPEAVVAYGSIYDHMEVVEQCAPRRIHVMVEKPLAVSLEHAIRMQKLAKENSIHILTNYETCWYPSNHYARRLSENIGDIFRIEVYDGHQGPIEIGCSKRFTDWLTDPELNGGGAVIDFGCYGANLATWLLNGVEPLDVYAVLRKVKPNVYPQVDDDASIVLRYPNLTVHIAASWCWPFGRKDMYIYGIKGMIHQLDPVNLVYDGKQTQAPQLSSPYDTSFGYLSAVVRGEIQVPDNDMAALANNIMVVRILDAACRSSLSGKAEKLR